MRVKTKLSPTRITKAELQLQMAELQRELRLRRHCIVILAEELRKKTKGKKKIDLNIVRERGAAMLKKETEFPMWLA